MTTYYKAEDIIRDRISQYTISKTSSDPTKEIELLLKHDAEISQSAIPLEPAKYCVVAEYSDIRIYQRVPLEAKYYDAFVFKRN